MRETLAKDKEKDRSGCTNSRKNCAEGEVVSLAAVFRLVTQRCVTSLKTAARETKGEEMFNNIEDVCHLDKSFVRPQSCDRFKPVCPAGAWLSYVHATVADIQEIRLTGKLGRLLLRRREGTRVA